MWVGCLSVKRTLMICDSLELSLWVWPPCYHGNHIVPPAQSWDEFFSRASADAPPGHAYSTPPTIRPSPVEGEEDPHLIKDHLAVQALIRAYQIRGNYQGLTH